MAMKGRTLSQVLAVVALSLALTCEGTAQQSQIILENKDVCLIVDFSDEIFFNCEENGPKGLFLTKDFYIKHIDIVFVVDASVSMYGRDIPGENSYSTELEIVKKGINQYIMEVTNEKTQIFLITFGSEINDSIWQTKDRIKNEVASLNGGGISKNGTDALVKAISQISEHEGRAILILFSDGTESISYDDIESRALEGNVEINIVLIESSLSTKSNRSKELRDLARNTHGFFITIQDEGHIEEVKKEFVNKYITYLEDVTISLEPLEGIEVLDENGGDVRTLLTEKELRRGYTNKLSRSLILEQPERTVVQKVAGLLLSYKCDDVPFDHNLDIVSTLNVEEIPFTTTYPFYIIVILILFSVVFVVALYIWKYHKRKKLKKGDNFYVQGDREYNSGNNEEALELFKKASEFYMSAKDKNRQILCRNRIKKCEDTQKELNENIPQLESIIEKTRSEKIKLQKLVGYNPPNGIYEFLFKNFEIRSLYGSNNLVDRARKHIDNRDRGKIRRDIEILRKELKNLERITYYYRRWKEKYHRYRDALNANLVQSGILDVSDIRRLCEVGEVEAIFYLNFLIDENKKRLLDHDRRKYIRIRREDDLRGVPQTGKEGQFLEPPDEIESEYGSILPGEDLEDEEEKKLDRAKIDEGLNFIRKYLRDVQGIEKIDILRRCIEVPEEEFESILEALKKEGTKEKQYFVDQNEEKVVVDYIILRDCIKRMLKKKLHISEILKREINNCSIPAEIQKRINDDLGSLGGDQHE